jgi:hypothetical protein
VDPGAAGPDGEALVATAAGDTGPVPRDVAHAAPSKASPQQTQHF